MKAPDSAFSAADISIDDWRFERHAQIGSTNEEARQRALAGDPGRLWIVADQQTAGRGRMGRRWSSPAGNLHASALLLDPCEPALAPQIGFVAGVALRRAAADLGDAKVALKWPNDLVFEGAKLAGLLVEGATTADRRMAAVVGVGVNCIASPQGLAYPTTHLSAVLGRPISAGDLFARLCVRFAEALALWDRGARFAAIRDLWLASAAGLGGPIHIAGPRGARDGLFVGLDPEGRLLLRAEGVTETIESADLTLIPPPSRSGEASSAPPFAHQGRNV